MSRSTKRRNLLRDPNAPKRCVSAYLMYQNAMRDTFRQRRPDLDFGQLAQYTSAMFAEMPQTEKVVWYTRAKEDKARYAVEIAKYTPPPGYDCRGDLTEAGAERLGIKLPVKKERVREKVQPKKAKDAPKRNVGAYLLYQNSIRKSIVEEHPTASFGDIAKYASAMFQKLHKDERAVWDQKAKDDKARYERQLREYRPPPGYDKYGNLLPSAKVQAAGGNHASADPNGKAAAGDAAGGLGSKKKRRKKAPKETGMPKRSSGAYVFFTNEFRPKLWKENPDLKFIEIGRVLGEKWRALSPKEKEPYEALADNDKARYQQEMKLYKRSKVSKEAVAAAAVDAVAAAEAKKLPEAPAAAQGVAGALADAADQKPPGTLPSLNHVSQEESAAAFLPQFQNTATQAQAQAPYSVLPPAGFGVGFALGQGQAYEPPAAAAMKNEEVVQGDSTSTSNVHEV